MNHKGVYRDLKGDYRLIMRPICNANLRWVGNLFYQWKNVNCTDCQKLKGKL